MKAFAIVTWDDAHATLDEQSGDDIRGKHRASIIHTTGYIVVNDDVGVSIAGEWLPPADGGDETFRSVTFVPKGMVREVKILRQRKSRATKSTPSGTSSSSSPSSRHSSPVSSSEPSTST